MRYTGIESIDERIEKKIEAAKKRKYFIMRELDECNKLIPELEEVVKDYKNALKPWYRTSWKDARDAAWYAALEALEDRIDAAWRVVLYAAWEDTWHAALEDALDVVGHGAYYTAAGHAALDAARAAVWEVIRNIKGYENNPFEKIVKIYDMGLYPRGFRKVNEIEKFIVHFPLKTYELGCWAEGDKEILYKHMWYENCNKIRPLRIIE
jgi:hypothetical protein